ncbi:phenazine biosynthesis protein phzE [Paraburkholderia phenazinium]|jgi:phenazine biosynthesis protein phzE|uniref:anthranilate synthase n=1 Tax=Paraburkholderia phenazinium TaxID=60549 RepID=A0A1G8JG14_9BURK|nr:anthranilate synthase family protein [Paraburkholderia phenazinium]SDI30135.1 phenazine biosynthesis protein phzE [Paraburkholderia phenazinium]
MSETLLSLLREAPERLGAFALLVRTGAERVPTLEIYAGNISSCLSLNEIPVPPPGHHGPAAIAVIPYRQLAERGYASVDDGERLRVIRVEREQRVPLDEALRQWPDGNINISEGRFDVEDTAYADKVREIIANEIGTGAGSNFVLKRTFQADLAGYSLETALTAFGRLVRRETGAYWTLLVHTGERTLIGASPERHVSLKAGVASMNPISGTYRYPPTGPTLKGIVEFLANKKENDELYMVVDEELKMMARFCKNGGKVIGPHLKEMSRLAHTEYVLEGETDADPREILRETLFSPAVTGSPIENACRVIAKYEPEGRRYYAGVLALLGRDAQDQVELDSAILIRTADIDDAGALRISVGATIVRHSDPESEAAETRTKALAVLNALGQNSAPDFSSNPIVISALQSRNDGISKFWQADAGQRGQIIPGLSGRELLIIDAEDAFTAMLGQQLRAMGLKISIAHYDDKRVRNGDWDLAVFGPGPGDPHNLDDPRIRALRQAISASLKQRKPFFAVCLSHQLLCLELGLPLVCRRQPNQGVQREINYFGTPERVGFYNTFNATYHDNELWHGDMLVEVCRDESSHEVHALRGSGFSSIQFHAESVLTQHGIEIVSQALLEATGSTLPQVN